MKENGSWYLLKLNRCQYIDNLMISKSAIAILTGLMVVWSLNLSYVYVAVCIDKYHSNT